MHDTPARDAKLPRLSFRDIAAALAATALLAGVTLWMVTPAPPPGFYWDDTWYLLMAEWLSLRRETWELAWTMLQLRQYPPLFPYLMSLAGAGLGHPQPAYILNASLLAGTGGVALLWFRLERFSGWAALPAALLVVFNPVALYWLPTLFSEHLYLLLTTLVLLLAGLRRDWVPLWLVAGIVTGLTIATRTPGWALAVALFVHLMLGRRWLPLTFLSVGIGIGWVTIPYLTVGLPDAKGYLDQFTELPYRFGVTFVMQQLTAIARGWTALWGGAPGALLALAVVLPGWWLRFRQNRPDAWYVPAYLGMLLLWPYPEHMSRFEWPLMPSLLVAAHTFVLRLGTPVFAPRRAGVTLALLLLLSVPAGLGRTLDRLLDPPGGELAALSRMPEWTRSGDRAVGLEVLQARFHLLQDVRHIERITAPGYCIYSELPALVTAQAMRAAYASPWEDLDRAGTSNFDCLYYYLLPGGLPGTTADRIRRFGARHEELFRSVDPGNGQPLGIFYNLIPTP